MQTGTCLKNVTLKIPWKCWLLSLTEKSRDETSDSRDECNDALLTARRFSKLPVGEEPHSFLENPGLYCTFFSCIRQRIRASQLWAAIWLGPQPQNSVSLMRKRPK